MLRFTTEERATIRAEAEKLAREMEASAATLTEEEVQNLIQSPRGYFLLARALALAIVANDKLPRRQQASSDQKDMLSMLLHGFSGLGQILLAEALEQDAVERRMVAANPRSGG